MVLLYCPEQIAVPATLPDILKTYAKAAIRTQPYDLLRWSANYFRSLADNDQPLMKHRLELHTAPGILTRGYLRTLVQQVGRGFFVNRIILQKSWIALCLPEDDLKKYLSLCRMLNWAQVHWLKLFGVLAGSITNCFSDTLTLVCELLSEDVEGGQARIPIWIFTAIYKFLAQLDCSTEQQFQAGRKVLENGELEPEVLIEELPYVLSTTSIRRALLDQCDELSEHTKSLTKSRDHLDEEPFKLKDFRVFGNNTNSQMCMRKIENFNTLIFYMKEYQETERMEKFQGPFHVTEANYKFANKQEEEIRALRELRDLNLGTNTEKHIYNEQMNMLKELGPPWNWIYQFTTENCIDRSYNLVEECSVISDVTPMLSSDESYDYLAEKPIYIDDKASSLDSQLESDSAPPETFEQIAEDLLGDNNGRCKRSSICKNRTHFIEVENALREAEKKQELNLENSDSIISIICKEELGILERAGKKMPPCAIDLKLVMNILKKSEKENVVFDDITQIIDFIVEEYNQVYDTFVPPLEGPPEEPTEESDSEVPLTIHDDESLAAMEMANIYGISNAAKAIDQRRKCIEKAEKDETEQRQYGATIDPMDQTFEKSGVAADAAVLARRVEKDMILGLVDPPSKNGDNEEEEDLDTGSELTITGASERHYSNTGYISDDSSIFITTEVVDDRKRFKICPDSDVSSDSVCMELCTFKCVIPVYPGIGGPVPEKVAAEFLSYIKFRAMEQRGLIMPANFKEIKCPPMQGLQEKLQQMRNFLPRSEF